MLLLVQFLLLYLVSLVAAIPQGDVSKTLSVTPTGTPSIPMPPDDDDERWQTATADELAEIGLPQNDVSSDALTYKYLCETTKGSPHAIDIKSLYYQLFYNLAAWGKKCIQVNDHGGGQGCTHVFRVRTATSAICGRRWDRLPCTDVARLMTLIPKNCEWFGLAGGWAKITGGKEDKVTIPVFHA